jgi:hypothetical protein
MIMTKTLYESNNKDSIPDLEQFKSELLEFFKMKKLDLAHTDTQKMVLKEVRFINGKELAYHEAIKFLEGLEIE